MRDLSISGAGNLLGAEQHGFMDSVGFDLYTQMLKEAIDSRKLGKPVEAVQPFNPESNVKSMLIFRILILKMENRRLIYINDSNI